MLKALLALLLMWKVSDDTLHLLHVMHACKVHVLAAAG